MRYHLTILFSLALIITSCRPNNNGQQRSVVVYDTVFNYCIEDLYGAFYGKGGLESNVVSLDLYSDGLTIGKQGIMEGSGTNLYFSDIFLDKKDTVLAAGYYTADTTGKPGTFLPGTRYEGNFTGAYLLRVDDGKLTSYRLLPKGCLTIDMIDDTCLLFFTDSASRRPYHAHFRSTLTIRDQKNGK